MESQFEIPLSRFKLDIRRVKIIFSHINVHKGIIGTYFSMFSHDDVGLIESSDLPSSTYVLE